VFVFIGIILLNLHFSLSFSNLSGCNSVLVLGIVIPFLRPHFN